VAEIIYIVERGKVKADLDDLLKKIEEAKNLAISEIPNE
jgi:hypothetical protein